MARWQPDAAERLMRASLDLFVEKGYDHTTVVEIAERAGVTKSTFFRHFRDKREALFGDESFIRILTDAMEATPPDATPLEVVAAGLDAVGAEAFTPARHELSGRRRAVIAANPELQERDALKGVRLTLAMVEVLTKRGVSELDASLAAGVGALTLNLAYQRWSDSTGDEPFAEIARHTLSQLQTAAASLR